MKPFSERASRYIFPNIMAGIAAAAITILFGCENEMTRIKEITQQDTLPSAISYNIILHRSENGQPQLTLRAPVVKSFSGSNPHQEFPDGLNIQFFDSLMNVRSELTADYAISYERTRTMEAKNNVEIINFDNNEKINTEHLVWDQNRRIIYSETFVRITTMNDVIHGEDGFEADESFDNWVIKRPTGEFEVQEDE